MTPSKFCDYQQRRLGRSLSLIELAAIQAARDTCKTGKRDTVKAMWVALDALADPERHRQPN
ncbi:MAG: hypothetical protein EOO77_20385 [Oxalobacteraceae bacterium]|nr:MAG: hypothetical protein EOO77_20385 [Oxalobacteraceae bacterium]